VAAVWLGLIGSFVAYLLYFHLVHNIGPTRAAMVTYTFPVSGLLLGAVFLGEQITLNLVAGSALVIVSLLIVNRARR
jgi:drug/metabolite transporter (DMT)-like permease